VIMDMAGNVFEWTATAGANKHLAQWWVK